MLVLHMYTKYVNFYLQSLLHLQKKLWFLFELHIYRSDIYIIMFLFSTNILYYNNEKQCTDRSVFFFLFFIIQIYFHKNISLYKKGFVCLFSH